MIFKNFHLKFLSLFLATFFWIFVVSLENTFYQVPQKIPVQVFNQAQQLALASQLEPVEVTVRTQNSVPLRTLSASDFEAYIDLRNVGAGVHTVQVSVTSTNRGVNIVRVEPKEIEVKLETTREKTVPLTLKVSGAPLRGFSVSDTVLLQQNVVVRGAESIVRDIAIGEAAVSLTGSENATVAKDATISIFNRAGEKITEITLTPEKVSARITIVEEQATKQVGVQPQTKGAVKNGVIKSIEVVPALVEITATSQVLDAVEFLHTEAVDVSELSGSSEKKVKLVLPDGVSLVEGQSREVTVKIEVE